LQRRNLVLKKLDEITNVIIQQVFNEDIPNKEGGEENNINDFKDDMVLRKGNNDESF